MLILKQSSTGMPMGLHFILKFFRNYEFCSLFKIHFQTGFFHFNFSVS